MCYTLRVPPKLPYTPTSELVDAAEPPVNPFIERRQRLEIVRRNHKINPPEKVRARKMVARAVAAGDLVPKPCSWRTDGHWCNKTPTEAHHRSYEPGRELDVRWLCKEHHDRLSSAEWSRKHGD